MPVTKPHYRNSTLQFLVLPVGSRMKRYQLTKIFFDLLLLSAALVVVEATFRYKSSHQSLGK